MPFVSKESVEYSLLGESEEQGNFQQRNSIKHINSTVAHWIIHAISIFLVLSIAVYAVITQHGLISTCALRHNTWSPALEVSTDPTEELYVTTLTLNSSMIPLTNNIEHSWELLAPQLHSRVTSTEFGTLPETF